MRYIILLMTLLPFTVAAQDCLLKKGKDAITSRPNLSTGFIDLTNATLSVDISSKEIDFFFVLSAQAVKCLDEATEATFSFEGGRLKSEFKNSGSMNCDGIFHIIFKNSAYTPSPLQKLGAKKILSLQFAGSTGKPFVIAFSPEQQQLLQQTIACVIKEAKTVL